MSGRPRPKILVTGFGRFPGVRDNPSAHLARALARQRPGIGVACNIRAHVFDVTYDGVDRDLPRLIHDFQPDVLVMFGIASRAATIRVEQVARNRLHSGLPDASRARASAIVASAAGPATRAARMSAQAFARAVKNAGCRARVSHDAGGYLCNYLYWRALDHPAMRGGTCLALFVHIPPRERMTPAERARLPATGRAILRQALVTRRR